MSKLVLIDGNAILHRAFHAMPRLTSKNGEPIGAVYGLVSMLIRIINDLKPTHIAVCFDRPEPTFRKKEFEKYQAQRPETDKELSGQFEKAKDVLLAMKIKTYDKLGFEADDLIGTIANKARFGEVVVVTGDRDILQLVDDKKKIRLYMPVKGLSDSKLYKKEDVVDRMGVAPSQIIDYKALVGDPSDNYPGIGGIGPKTAEKLLGKYKTFANIYKHLDELDELTRKKLTEKKSDGEISYKLAKIVTNVDFKFDTKKMDDWDLGSPEVIKLFMKIGFKTLTKRVGGEVKEEKTFRKNLTKSDVEKIVMKLAKKLKGKKYAIRGTASMVLQDLDMGVDDIDIVADKKTALSMNKIFKDKVIEDVKYSKSEKFKSYYGKLTIDDVLVEVMGDFQVKDQKGGWTKAIDGGDDQVIEIAVDGQKVNLTKLDLELDLSAKMGRWNEFQKIKKELEKKNQGNLF